MAKTSDDPQKIKLSKVLQSANRRGFSPRRLYVYDGCVIFVDLGCIWIYTPSSIAIRPGKGDVEILHIEPMEEAEDDTVFYDQMDIMLKDSKIEVEDSLILKDNCIFTAVRKRKWKSRKKHKLGIKLAVDLPTFLKDSALYNKARIAESHLHLILSTQVQPNAEEAKKEYESYIDSVLDQMSMISNSLSEERRQIDLLRKESQKRGNLQFVSLDIKHVHAISMHEKEIRSKKADLLLAKNMLKEAVANLGELVLMFLKS